MSIRKTGIGAGLAAAVLSWAGARARRCRTTTRLGLQPAASPVMEQIESFHQLLLYIIVAICLFVLALLVWIIVRYNRRANPTPSKTHHNTLLEVAWTIIPVIILVVIAIPSFKLLYYEADIPKPDVHHQGHRQAVVLDLRISGRRQLPVRLAGPVRRRRRQGAASRACWASTTSSSCRSTRWSRSRPPAPTSSIPGRCPQMGVKMDAVPGRLNHTWFKATRTGTFYGECSELCGASHAFMPIEVKVVSDARIRRLARGGEEEIRRDRQRQRHAPGRAVTRTTPWLIWPTRMTTTPTATRPAGAASSIRRTTRTSARCT